MASHFGDRLFQAVNAKKTPLTVGLDPVYNRLPEAIRSHRSMNDELDMAAAVDAILDFCVKTLRVVAPLVPAVKINIAYFERYFSEGNEAYYSLIEEADELGLEVIGDVKRGDIGHTAEAYADAHLRNPELVGAEDIVVPDAITVNAFAGTEGLLPFVKAADEQGKGVFVWIRGSNPSATALQDFADGEGVCWYEKLAEIVGQIAAEPAHTGQSGFSNVGMIVAGTSPEKAAELRDKYPNVWFLVPGYGSQGASAADCLRFSKTDGTGALINASRSIIYAYERPKYREQYGDNWQKCIEQAVVDAKVELATAMQAKLV